MQTFLELEGNLGPKLQEITNQFRPSHPDTNPKIRKNVRLQKRGREWPPMKRFRTKIVGEPNSNKATVQPPNTKAQMNTENHKTMAPTSQNTPSPL